MKNDETAAASGVVSGGCVQRPRSFLSYVFVPLNERSPLLITAYLAAHNAYRRLHGSSDLVVDDILVDDAFQFAQYLLQIQKRLISSTGGQKSFKHCSKKSN